MEADFDQLHISLVNWIQLLRPYQDVLEPSRLQKKAVVASRDIVGYAPLTLLVPHSVSLLERKTPHLSAAQWLRYSTVLLDLPNITVKRRTILNPAGSLHTSTRP